MLKNKTFTNKQHLSTALKANMERKRNKTFYCKNHISYNLIQNNNENTIDTEHVSSNNRKINPIDNSIGFSFVDFYKDPLFIILVILNCIVGYTIIDLISDNWTLIYSLICLIIDMIINLI